MTPDEVADLCLVVVAVIRHHLSGVTWSQQSLLAWQEF